MIEKEICIRLQELQDAAYRDMQRKIIPTVTESAIVGVRTPALRSYAKELGGRADLQDFLNSLPHRFFEENQLHAFIISGMKDYGQCMAELERFLPYVDNWASCDQMSPKVFRKHRPQLLARIRSWLTSGHCYTLCFAVKMLMDHFLDEDFDPGYLQLVASVSSEEYYVRMMVAWYFATALAKQYDAAIAYIEGRRLAPWTHNKAIQKALESYRVGEAQKDYLRGLKMSGA